MNNNTLFHIDRVFQCHSLTKGHFSDPVSPHGPLTAYYIFQISSNAYFTKMVSLNNIEEE